MTNAGAGEMSPSWMLKNLPEMDERQFQQWQTLIEKRTGMSLPPERKTFLQTNLGIRMREIGCQNYQEYYEQVSNSPAGFIEWAILVDRLTVQETRFYRDEHAYSLMVDYILTRPLARSEEHTSELQSRPHLVCRLL